MNYIELATKIYEMLIKVKELNPRDNIIPSKSRYYNEIGNAIIETLELEYRKVDLVDLLKDTEKETMLSLEESLKTKDGIRDIDYRMYCLLDMDDNLYNIDDTVMYFYGRVPNDICKKAVFDKYQNDIDNLPLYWDVYVAIQDIQTKLEPLYNNC